MSSPLDTLWTCVTRKTATVSIKNMSFSTFRGLWLTLEGFIVEHDSEPFVVSFDNTDGTPRIRTFPPTDKNVRQLRVHMFDSLLGKKYRRDLACGDDSLKLVFDVEDNDASINQEGTSRNNDHYHLRFYRDPMFKNMYVVMESDSGMVKSLFYMGPKIVTAFDTWAECNPGPYKTVLVEQCKVDKLVKQCPFVYFEGIYSGRPDMTTLMRLIYPDSKTNEWENALKSVCDDS